MTKRLDLFDSAAAKYVANDRRRGQMGLNDSIRPAPARRAGTAENLGRQSVKRSDFTGDRYTTPQLR